MTRSVLLAAGAALVLAACAQPPTPGSPGYGEQARAVTVKDSVAEAPAWFLSPPADDSAIYAPGTATSGDLQLALDKAVMAAKRSLADRINSKLSSKMKEMLAESGSAEDATVTVEIERVTHNLITEVNLSGYIIVERKFMPAGQAYRAYVLVRYPLGSANRILVDQVKKDAVIESRLRASRAFQELERDIEHARPPAAAAKPEEQKP